MIRYDMVKITYDVVKSSSLTALNASGPQLVYAALLTGSINTKPMIVQSVAAAIPVLMLNIVSNCCSGSTAAVVPTVMLSAAKQARLNQRVQELSTWFL